MPRSTCEALTCTNDIAHDTYPRARTLYFFEIIWATGGLFARRFVYVERSRCAAGVALCEDVTSLQTVMEMRAVARGGLHA